MPWYTLTYIALFCLMTLGSTLDDIKEKRPLFHIFGNISSLIFIIIFCYSYYKPEYAVQIGFRFIPMVVLGFLWEVYITTLDINEVSNDEPDLNPNETQIVLVLSHVTIASFTLIGYVPGVFLAWEYLQ